MTPTSLSPIISNLSISSPPSSPSSPPKRKRGRPPKKKVHTGIIFYIKK